MALLRYLFSPLLFGLGFLAPLIAQSLTLADISFAGIENLYLGLLIGGLWGLMAQLRGSWIWVKP